jgi:hypothetical protein
MAKGDAEMITAGEFGRFREDLSSWQDRLVGQLGDGFKGVHDRLDELNGRTRKNSEGLAEVIVRQEHFEPVVDRIQSIQEHGCAQIDAHRAMLATGDVVLGPPAWDSRKKAIVGGGLIAGGAALWPVLQGILGAAHQLLDHFAGK